MKNITILFIFLITSLGVAQNLSFEEAIEKLQTGNKKILGTKKKEASKKQAAKSVKGLRFPELKLSGSYVYMSDHMYADLNKHKSSVNNLTNNLSSTLATYGAVAESFTPILVKYAHLPQVQNLMKVMQQTKNKMKSSKHKMEELMKKDWKYKFQDQQFAKITLELKYPIFTGGKINAGIKLKQLQSEIAGVETKKIEGVLIAKLAERYFQTKLAEEAVLVRKQSLESAQQHLFNAKKMKENGMLAPIQEMLAKTAVADAKRALMASVKDAELAKTALEGLLGGNYIFTDLTTNLFKLKKIEELSYFQSLAKKNYPDIVKAQVQRNLAQQNIKYHKSGHFPSIALIGKKNLYTKNLPIIEPQDWFVGIGFDMHIFHGFKEKRKIQEAKLLKESVDLFIEQAKVDVQTLVKKYYTEILKQQEQLESLEESVQFSEELVRVREKAFKEGLATSTEVADANLYAASIKIKKLKAMFEIDKNLAKLLETSGIGNKFVQYK